MPIIDAKIEQLSLQISILTQQVKDVSFFLTKVSKEAEKVANISRKSMQYIPYIVNIGDYSPNLNDNGDQQPETAQKQAFLRQFSPLARDYIFFFLDNKNKSKNKRKRDNIKLSHKIFDIRKSAVFQQCLNMIGANLTPQENARLMKSSETQARAWVKLQELGYTDAQIRQAVYNATRDDFWRRNCRSISKLSTKTKAGDLCIDLFLSLNQQAHKMPTGRNPEQEAAARRKLQALGII